MPKDRSKRRREVRLAVPRSPYGRYLSTCQIHSRVPTLISAEVQKVPKVLLSPAAEKPKGTNEDPGIEMTSSTKVWPASLH